MQEYSDQLKSELKRADHLFYVSLKYTRTVDVIRSVIERFMNALDIGIEAMLAKKKKEKISGNTKAAKKKSRSRKGSICR